MRAVLGKRTPINSVYSYQVVDMGINQGDMQRGYVKVWRQDVDGSFEVVDRALTVERAKEVAKAMHMYAYRERILIESAAT